MCFIPGNFRKSGFFIKQAVGMSIHSRFIGGDGRGEEILKYSGRAVHYIRKPYTLVKIGLAVKNELMCRQWVGSHYARQSNGGCCPCENNLFMRCF